ncbi:MAG: hypothetical protein OHK0050_33720 [Roseiflexaceae bacterium]
MRSMNIRFNHLLIRALRSLATFLVCLLAFWIFICAMVVVQGRRDEVRQADAVLALDAQRGPGDAAAQAELDRALLLHRRELVRQIILSGGGESSAARRYLTQRGAPEGIILIADSAADIPERVRYAGDLACSSGSDSLIIVTEPHELLRALKVARDLGLESYGSPVGPQYRPIDAISATIREGWLYMRYVLVGW